MQQADLIRARAWVGAAAVGAGLALAGAAVPANSEARPRSRRSQRRAPRRPSAPSPLGREQPVGGGDLPARLARRRADHRRGRAPRRASLGSGFVIDKAGHIVTSNRVVSGSPSLHVQLHRQRRPRRRRSSEATPPRTSRSSRSTLTRARSARSRWATRTRCRSATRWSRSATPAASTARRPSASSAPSSTGSTPRASPREEHAIRTDAAVDGANAGGPLINAHGLVIGVSSRSSSGSGRLRDPDRHGEGGRRAAPRPRERPARLPRHRSGAGEREPRALLRPPDRLRAAGRGVAERHAPASTPASAPAARRSSSPASRTGSAATSSSRSTASPSRASRQLRNVLQTKKPGDTLALLQVWRGKDKQTVHVKLGRPPG